ncbi:hypothetical protein [Bacteroides finegoldii]|nr:hypothetical protein [Bacteroides finegoldii]MDC7141192.1 hypothetical protein [Bacteroides finegoldii]
MVPETGGAENRLGCPDERLPPAEGIGGRFDRTGGATLQKAGDRLP